MLVNGLKCVAACGDCQGESCSNIEEIGLETETEGPDYWFTLHYSLNLTL